MFLLRKNLQSIKSSISYLFDLIEIDKTHWLRAISFLDQKLPDRIKNGPTPSTRLLPPNHMNHSLAIMDTIDQLHHTHRSSFQEYAELNEVAVKVLNAYYTNFKQDRSPDPKLKAF